MKTTHFLLTLASLSLASVGLHAAAADTTDEVVVLPTFRVEVPRQSPLERKIAQSLHDFCSVTLSHPATAVPFEAAVQPVTIAEGSEPIDDDSGPEKKS